MTTLKSTKHTRYFELIKIILSTILSLLVISLISFFLVQIAPGDPVATYLHSSGIRYTPAIAKITKVELGLDKPLIVQYYNWLIHAVQGDFGTSFLTRKPVLSDIWRAMKNTFYLGGFSMIWLTIISLSLALISTIKVNKFMDKLIFFFSLASTSFPNFFLAYLLILLFAAKLHIFPVSGMSQNLSVILPSFALMMPMLGQSTLFLRKCFLEIINEDHVKNAILRGVSPYFLIKNHILRNATASLITLFSWNLMALLTGSVIIESVFAWPGIGTLFVKAVQNTDIKLIQGSILLFAIIIMTINRVTQILVYYLVPSKRYESERMSYEE